ncbi:hypothetical protein EYR36_000126 [Pleurotus pulmonarius]|nr:hypothetical protein EYR36_000126 [Pleurotus pulmonarius]
MDNVGILAISTLILVVLYGMAVVQAILYFGRFRRKDPRMIQIVVLLVCVLAFVQLIFMCTSLYSFTITHFLAPSHTVRIPQALVLAVFVGSITHPLIQATLTFRMWKLGWTQGCPYNSRFVAPICWTISAYILGSTMYLSLRAIFAVQDKDSLIDYIENNSSPPALDDMADTNGISVYVNTLLAL